MLDDVMHSIVPMCVIGWVSSWLVLNPGATLIAGRRSNILFSSIVVLDFNQGVDGINQINYVLQSSNKTSVLPRLPLPTSIPEWRQKKEPNSCNTSLRFLRENISSKTDMRNDKTLISFVIFCHNLLKTLFYVLTNTLYISYNVNFDEHFYGPLNSLMQGLGVTLLLGFVWLTMLRRP